jgi:hypothetical protein
MLALVVLSQITKKVKIVANMTSYAINSSMILVIHDNMINVTNHIVEHIFVTFLGPKDAKISHAK